MTMKQDGVAMSEEEVRNRYDAGTLSKVSVPHPNQSVGP
jgi:hypothetical protein